MRWLPDGKKKFDDTIIRFDRIHECDRWTDTYVIDTHRMTANAALAYHLRVKKNAKMHLLLQIPGYATGVCQCGKNCKNRNA